MAEHDIYLPIPLLQNRFNLGLDGLVRLLIRPPSPAPGQSVFLVHTVSTADGETVFPQKVIDLAIYGKQKIGIFWLDENYSAAKELFFIALLCRRPLLVISVDTENGKRQFREHLLKQSVFLGTVIIDPCVPKDNQQILPGGLLRLTKCIDPVKTAVGIASQVNMLRCQGVRLPFSLRGAPAVRGDPSNRQ